MVLIDQDGLGHFTGRFELVTGDNGKFVEFHSRSIAKIKGQIEQRVIKTINRDKHLTLVVWQILTYKPLKLCDTLTFL